MQKVAYCGSDAVILLLAQNESCRCIEYILQWPDVSSAGAVQDAVAVIYATGDKCMYPCSSLISATFLMLKAAVLLVAKVYTLNTI